MRKSLPCLACLLALLLAGLAPGVSAWSNGGYSSDQNNPDYGTHDYLLEHALSMLPTAEKNAIVHNLSLALYGTEMPDNPDEIYDQSKHHVYYNSAGQLTDDSAADRAQEEYDLALGYLQSGDWTNADKRIGAMSHYITDLAVFGHVMGAYTDWGAEDHHSDYESYVQYRTESYTSSDFDGYLVYDGSLTGMSASSAVTDLAYTITFGSGSIKSCTWMDANYSWSSSTFKDSCGASMNLAANNLAEVLHRLYLDYTSPANNAPTLSSGSVSPASGSSSTTFTYEVTYTDNDGDAPSYVRVYIDGTSYSMTEISGAYTSGALYQYIKSGLGENSHTYYFEASDNRGSTVRLPSSGSYSGPTVTAAQQNRIRPGGTYTVTIDINKPTSLVLGSGDWEVRAYFYSGVSCFNTGYWWQSGSDWIYSGWYSHRHIGDDWSGGPENRTFTIQVTVVDNPRSQEDLDYGMSNIPTPGTVSLRARLVINDIGAKFAPIGDGESGYVTFTIGGLSYQYQYTEDQYGDINISGEGFDARIDLDNEGKWRLLIDQSMSVEVSNDAPETSTIVMSSAINLNLTSATLPITTVSENVPASTGGTVVIDANTKIEIPANAISQDTTFTMTEKTVTAPSGYKLVSKVYEIGPTGTIFNTPTTITLPYLENEIPAGVSEDDLGIYRRTGSGSSWERVGGNVDKVANTVSVQVDHLSEYAVMASVSEGGAGGGGLPWLTIGVAAVVVVACLAAGAIIFIRRRRGGEEFEAWGPPAGEPPTVPPIKIA